MLKSDSKSNCRHFIVDTVIALSLLAVLSYAAPLKATTMGSYDSDSSGEILEPSAVRPTGKSENVDDLPGLRALPEPSIEVYEKLGAAIERSRRGPRSKRSAGPSAEGFSGLHDKLTALEWVDLWSENGYWLENDQWYDFQAIALASYLPDLKYWLGRDRWAAFGTGVGLGDGEKDGFSSTETNGSMATGSLMPGPYGAGYGHTANGDGQDGRDDEAHNKKTFEELLLWMIKKLSTQPLFYIVLIVLIGVLGLTMRREST